MTAVELREAIRLIDTAPSYGTLRQRAAVIWKLPVDSVERSRLNAAVERRTRQLNTINKHNAYPWITNHTKNDEVA